MGPNPRYRPLIPSSLKIVLAEPMTPRYILFGGLAPAFLEADQPPCACSFVLITSSGQVTIPLARPAPAPETGLSHAFGSDNEYICTLERNGETVVGAFWEAISWRLVMVGESSLYGAYCVFAVASRSLAGGVVARSSDILCSCVYSARIG